MKQNTLPWNLQFFASEGDNGDTGTGADNNAGGAGTQPAFDYEKLAGLIAGKQSVTEDTVLKSYFKQQGLSKEEMEQAIQGFKAEKAKNQPDVNAIQTQLTQAQSAAQQAAVEKEAIMEAVALGVDAKTIPYLIKLADLSAVTDAEGKVNAEELKKALNKVLEDVPQLKPQKEGNKGFQIGGGGSQQTNQSDQLASIFGNKK